MTKKRILFIVCPVLIALTVAIVLIISVRNTKSVPEIEKTTTFFWGYEDITDSVAEPIDTKGMEIEEHLYMVTVDPKTSEEEEQQLFDNLKKEIANIAVGYVNPETLNGENATTETEIAVFWKANKDAYTFTTADKEVAEIHIDGLDKRVLKRLTPDGFILQFTEPGDYACWYYAFDEEGKQIGEVGRRFIIDPAASTTA